MTMSGRWGWCLGFAGVAMKPSRNEMAREHDAGWLNDRIAAQSVSTAVDTLGKTGRYVSGHAAIRVWSDCLASCPIGIGS